MPYERTRLGQTGPIRITDAAARRYADEYGIHVDQARAELAEHLAMASQPESDRGRTEGPERWRRRNRSAGIDITAQVIRQDGAAVVVAINVRDHVSSGGRR